MSKVIKIHDSMPDSNQLLPEIESPPFPQGGSLYQRVARGGFWVFSLRITERVFTLIRLVILARILAPHDFGLMGIALVTMATLDIFSQTGFQAALIQKKGNTESYLDAAWTIMIVRGLILFTVLYLIAPYAAVFFRSPQATPIIRIIGFSMVFQASTNIGVIYFQKELEFNKQFVYQLSGTLADFIVAVSSALILRSVWALVFGLLAGSAARFVVSYLIHPYRPHISFDLAKVKELFGFGKWVLGSSISLFLITQCGDIFVGKLLGTTALGFYQLAYRISNMPATEIAHGISQITFPAYSKLQDSIPRLRRAFLQTVELSALISLPLAAAIFILAPDFVNLFLGEKWSATIPAIRVLAVLGAIRSISFPMGSLLYALGKPRIITETQFAKLLLIAVLIYPMTTKFGIVGTCFSITIPTLFVNIPLLFYRTRRYLKGSFSLVFESFKAPFACTLFAVLGILSAYQLSVGTKAVNFFLSVLSGCTIYILSVYLLTRRGTGNLQEIFVGLREALVKNE